MRDERSSNLKCGTSKNSFKGRPLTRKRYPLGAPGMLSPFSAQKHERIHSGIKSTSFRMPLETNSRAKFHMNSDSSLEKTGFEALMDGLTVDFQGIGHPLVMLLMNSSEACRVFFQKSIHFPKRSGIGSPVRRSW